MRHLTISNKHNIHLWGEHKTATIKTSTLKRGNGRRGSMQSTICILTILLDRRRRTPSFGFKVNFLGDLFCLLWTCFLGRFPCNLSCMGTAKNDTEEYLLSDYHIWLTVLFLLVWLKDSHSVLPRGLSNHTPEFMGIWVSLVTQVP